MMPFINRRRFYIGQPLIKQRMQHDCLHLILSSRFNEDSGDFGMLTSTLLTNQIRCTPV